MSGQEKIQSVMIHILSEGVRGCGTSLEMRHLLHCFHPLSSLAPSQAESVRILLDAFQKAPSSFEDCIGLARKQFEEHYHNMIAQMVFTFPPDYKTSEGQPFWSGPKRCPKPITFDPSDVSGVYEHRYTHVSAQYDALITSQHMIN